MQIRPPSILDPSDTRSLVYGANYVIMVLAMIGALFKWVAHGQDHPPLPALVVVLLALLVSVYMYRGGATRIAAWAHVLTLLLALLFVGFTSGAFGGPIVLIAPLVPLLAVLLIDASAGRIVALLVFFSLSFLFALQVFDLVPENPNSATGLLVGRYLAVAFSSLIAAWVAWGFAESWRRVVADNEQLANTDHLTGIANRRRSELQLRTEVARARRSDAWLSLIMIDVDHFKRFNDLNGHPAGDACLVLVAGVLAEAATRPADLAGRFGGEEFVVLLADTDPEGARHIADQIQTNMQSCAPPCAAGDSGGVTLSQGVISVRSRADLDAEALIKAADVLLYRAKEQGRDRVISDVLDGIGQEAANTAP